MIYGVDYETRTLSGLPLERAKAEPLRCGSCGQSVESLSRCVWDETLSVGACCEVYTDHQCPACNADNLEFSDAGVKCLDCGSVTTENACEVEIGPFMLTSPTEMPRLESIRIRPVRATVSEVRRNGAA